MWPVVACKNKLAGVRDMIHVKFRSLHARKDKHDDSSALLMLRLLLFLKLNPCRFGLLTLLIGLMLLTILLFLLEGLREGFG